MSQDQDSHAIPSTIQVVDLARPIIKEAPKNGKIITYGIKYLQGVREWLASQATKTTRLPVDSSISCLIGLEKKACPDIEQFGYI
jgi:hypothetical protein